MPYIIVINAIPILIWLFMSPLSERFSSWSQTFTSLGQVSALLGMTLCATAIILGARLPFINKIIGNFALKHHRIGSTSFMLLLLHPASLAISYSFYSLRSAALLFLPNANQWPKTAGIISLAIMIALLVVTFYFAIRYKLWKFSHRFLVLAFAFGFIHSAFITSDISENIHLRFFVLAYSSLAFIAYAYHLFLEFGGVNKNQISPTNNSNNL